jgi:hypothetical protein
MINERGIWTSTDETSTHLFDKKLCDAIIKGLNPNMSVVDIGCGNGAYTMAIREAGIRCVGYDGSPLTEELTNGICKIMDFSYPVKVGRYDVVLSLEVGEHIPVEFESIFIDNLVRASKRFIILSWAIEDQPGTGHINCRNNDYIIDQMDKRGFFYCPEASQILRINSELPWFKDTLMVFERKLPC